MDALARGWRVLLIAALVPLGGGAACARQSMGPVGYSPPRPAERGARAPDGGGSPEPSPVPGDFRAHMTRLADRFVSHGHAGRFQAILWANDAARGDWEKAASLPDGSLLVEETIDHDSRGDRPAGLLVMEKAGGAWRFTVTGTAGEVVADARVAPCATCHRDATRDFVFSLPRPGPTP